jgi:hypothetical protein
MRPEPRVSHLATSSGLVIQGRVIVDKDNCIVCAHEWQLIRADFAADQVAA